jgi:hypothetical protein
VIAKPVGGPAIQRALHFLTGTYGPAIRTPVGAHSVRHQARRLAANHQQNRLEEAGPDADPSIGMTRK